MIDTLDGWMEGVLVCPPIQKADLTEVRDASSRLRLEFRQFLVSLPKDPDSCQVAEIGSRYFRLKVKYFFLSWLIKEKSSGVRITERLAFRRVDGKLDRSYRDLGKGYGGWMNRIKSKTNWKGKRS